MAKPPSAGRYDQKKAEPLKDTSKDVEEEGPEKEGPDTSLENQQQNALGNAAIQNQVMATDPTDAGDGGGGGGGLSMRKSGVEDKDYGGDGDAGADVPITLEDLTRSWNPGTNKSEDRPSWLEPMPSDELPPEDKAFLAEVKDAGPLRVEPGFTLDARLQPSSAVVAASLLDWSRGVLRWVEPTLLHRSIGHTLVPPTSFLQDAHGRLLITRARTGAIGTLLLLDAPLFSVEPTPNTIAFVQYLLELEGHRRHAEMVRIDPGVEGKQMPKTVTVFERAFERRAGAVQPLDLPETAVGRLDDLLAHLLDMEDPSVYIPAMILEYEEPEEDDPLGLDALMMEMTGGEKDDNGSLFYAAIQAAEKLAAATARTRIHVAGTAVSIAQVARMFSAGPPFDTLESVCQTVDRDTDRNLRLLVEIARAAQRRSVPPKGLKAGLLRAAKALRGTITLTRQLMAQISGGILPAHPEVPPPFPRPSDPLEEAWLDGNPKHAKGWMAAQANSPEGRLADLLLQGAIGREPPELAEPLMRAAETMTSPYMKEVVHIYAAPCLLAAGDLDSAHRIAQTHIEMGITRRNGMLLAHGTLLAIDAHLANGDADLASKTRLEGGRTAWRIGAPGGLSIIARWRPPEG